MIDISDMIRSASVKMCTFICSCAFAYSIIAYADEIAFSKMEIVPLLESPDPPGSPFVFVAKGNRVEVRFLSYRNPEEGPVNVFPEVPVTIMNRAKDTYCLINEGGNWTTDVYISLDERYLIMSEFSGSNSELVSYNTENCKRIKQVDTSAARFSIDGSSARIGENCSDRTIESCITIRPLDLRGFIKY